MTVFGWLRRRLVREHVKLLIQNSAACQVLNEGWYANDSEVSNFLKRRGVIVSGISHDFDRLTGFPGEVANYLLELNKELCRLHGAGPEIAGEGFDNQYEPLGGYKDATNRFLDE